MTTFKEEVNKSLKKVRIKDLWNLRDGPKENVVVHFLGPEIDLEALRKAGTLSMSSVFNEIVKEKKADAESVREIADIMNKILKPANTFYSTLAQRVKDGTISQKLVLAYFGKMQ
jgi:hypothetical protein